MCEYLSVVVTGNGRILVSADMSHESIITAHGLDDTGRRARKAFVRAECANGMNISYDDDVPEWYEKKRIKFEAKIQELFLKLKPIDDEHRAKRKPIDDEYLAKLKPIDDEHRAKRKPINDEYLAKLKPIDDEYSAKLKPIYDEYLAKRKTIDDEYLAKLKTFDDEYTSKMQAIADKGCGKE